MEGLFPMHNSVVAYRLARMVRLLGCMYGACILRSYESGFRTSKVVRTGNPFGVMANYM